MRGKPWLGACALLVLASGGPAHAGQPLLGNFVFRPAPLITPIIEGKHCQFCCVKEDSKCTKWCDIDCGDIIVRNNVFIDKSTGKAIQLRQVPKGALGTPKIKSSPSKPY